MLRLKGFSASNRLVFSALAAVFAASSFAGDQTWDAGTNYQWDATSANWGGSVWNNTGTGAIFGPTGVGTIGVGSVNVRSMNFTGGGYVLNGGTINLTNPTGSTSTLGAGIISVGTGLTATINSDIITSSTSPGLMMQGGGTLNLGGNNSLNGFTNITTNGVLKANLLVFASSSPSALAGTVNLTSANAIANNTAVAIGQGYVDIGSGTRTLGSLIFLNFNPSAAWNSTLSANNGIIGSGVLKVTGDIAVVGQNGGNFGNTIAAQLDMNGGTQIVRSGVTSSFANQRAIMFTNTISNGSFFKSIGYTAAGIFGSVDGSSLHGNNTFTGEAKFNSGTNYISGTNATTAVKIAGFAGPGGSVLKLMGANGSVSAADTIKALAGGTFDLDNNAAEGAAGTNAPSIAAANNTNRIKDTAAVELRDGGFNFRGFSNSASSETFGSLSATGGSNVLTVTSSEALGTSTLNIGSMSLAPRATLGINGRTQTGASTMTASLGATGTGASKIFVGSGVPTAVGGIIPRLTSGTSIIGGSSHTAIDYVTYDNTNGFTPYTGYVSAPATGANLALTAASTLTGGVQLNSLKTSGTIATNLGGFTVGLDTGMVLSSTGTSTISNGTLAFGANPGVFYGTNTVSAALTGSAGLITGTGTLTLSGDLSGLSGNIDHNSAATLAVNTNTFAGDIYVRQGTLSFNTSQTTGGAIHLGVPENDADMMGTVPTFTLSSAGANAVINRNIVVDNGITSIAGAEATFGFMPLIQPLSNTTGSQTINGNILLNTSVNLQGGGASGTSTGATNIAGTVSGAGKFFIPNGRANFTASSTVSNAGGFVLGNNGNTAKISFLGSVVGTAPITFNGGNSNTLTYSPGSLPTGQLTFRASSATTAVSFIPNATSSINNAIELASDLNSAPGAGVVSTWNGPLTGVGTLNHIGLGTTSIAGTATGYTGNLTLTAGTLAVNTVLGATGPTSATATVNTGATLGGAGTLVRNVTVNTGGHLAPGNSPGVLTVLGNVSFTGGTFDAEVNGNVAGVSYDQLSVSGNVALGAGVTTLNLLGLTGTYNVPTDRLVLINNTGNGTTTGTFAGFANDTAVGNWGGSEWRIFYGYNTATDSWSGGNDVVLAPVPEPASLIALGLGAAGLLRRRKRNS